nr:hypothetical protein [uncultured Clostridium sp.]
MKLLIPQNYTRTIVTPGTYRKAMEKDQSFTQRVLLPPNSVAALAIGTQLVN